MEQELAVAGLSTTGVAILFVVYRVFKAVQGKKLVSNCCGHKGEVGFSVQDMSPVPVVVQEDPVVVQDNPIHT
jgi:hypothetical protein